MTHNLQIIMNHVRLFHFWFNTISSSFTLHNNAAKFSKNVSSITQTQLVLQNTVLRRVKTRRETLHLHPLYRETDLRRRKIYFIRIFFFFLLNHEIIRILFCVQTCVDNWGCNVSIIFNISDILPGLSLSLFLPHKHTLVSLGINMEEYLFSVLSEAVLPP